MTALQTRDRLLPFYRGLPPEHGADAAPLSSARVTFTAPAVSPFHSVAAGFLPPRPAFAPLRRRAGDPLPDTEIKDPSVRAPNAPSNLVPFHTADEPSGTFLHSSKKSHALPIRVLALERHYSWLTLLGQTFLVSPLRATGSGRTTCHVSFYGNLSIFRNPPTVISLPRIVM